MATYPNTDAASDIWSLRDVYKAEAGDEWPSSQVLFDLSSASYDSNTTGDLSNGNLGGVYFKPDGLSFYVASYTNDNVQQYDLTTAWDLSTASLANQKGGGVGTPRDIFFSPDGLRMFTVDATTDDVDENVLSTAWDLSTASAGNSFGVQAQEGTVNSIYFHPDGTYFYVSGTQSDSVNQYSLSTAWDLTTASFVQSFSVSSQTVTPNGISFNQNGRQMYIVEQTNDVVLEYNLSTPWDISTASYNTSFSVATEESLPQGIFIREDGLKFFICGAGGDSVDRYSMDNL